MFFQRIIKYLAGALILMLCSCAGAPEYRIGVSQCSQDEWRNKVNDEIRREMFFHKDAEVEIRSAQDNNSKQIADIDYFVANKFDLIIVAPNEAEAIAPAVKRAFDAGIPVIVFDREINGDFYTAKIGVDNAAIGRQAAQYARANMPGTLKILELKGLDGSSPAAGRHAGFIGELGPGMELVESIDAGWYLDQAERATDSLLVVHPEINLIYAHNDRMAIGAANATRRHGRNDIKIIGIDAAPSVGIKAVADGVIDATFFYPTEGQLLIKTALQILRGEPYARETRLPVLSPVDSTNADIMLRQSQTIADETAKMLVMKERADDYGSRYSAQTVLFALAVVVLVLLFAVLFVVLRAYRQSKRYQSTIEHTNSELQQERDRQKELYRQLDNATRSKLMFYTNVSHDLRTPLSLVAEPIEQLRGSATLSDSERHLLDIAARNVKTLLRLVNEILDFRKAEDGRLELHATEGDFFASVGTWLDGFRPLGARRHIKLIYRRPEGAPTLAFDAEGMERVLFNIITNAFRHTPDGGTISVEGSVADGTISVTVSDTGEGIAPGDLPHIFESFYQAEHGHTGNSGLGLAVAKAFVELHGGTISAASEQGRGTAITISLPVRHVDTLIPSQGYDTDASAATPPIEPADTSDTTDDTAGDDDRPLVLAVDDNPDILSLLSVLLKNDFRVVTASDGASALRLANKLTPDLIISDLMMPGIDGLELCRRLKSETSTSHIPVLMLTACSLDEQRLQGYESGADAYLPKPFRGDMLLARCRNLLANRRRIADLYAPGGSLTPVTELPGDLDSEFYKRFMDFFNGHLADANLNVEQMSQALALSQSQFTRKIKALTGYTPIELVRKLRLEAARKLLTGTDRPVSDIAARTGFASQGYFAKCFKDAYGESPTDIRRRLTL